MASRHLVVCRWLAGLTLSACAGAVFATAGKLLLTGGVASIDGAAGGGLTPWAVTGSYATRGEVGATTHLSGVRTRDYALVGGGVALSWNDRLELSLARQDLDTRGNLAPLGLPLLHLKLDIVGVKLRLAGDAVLDADTWMPQLALGVFAKRSDAGDLAPTLYRPGGVLGAKQRGTDLYLSATKLLLAEAVLVNLTLRATKANQGGLLGFGSATAERTKVMPEASLVWLASPRLAFGAEARAKPDNLAQSALGAGALKEDDWFDLFVAWAPDKLVSVTFALVDLGRIAPALQPRRQTGGFLSVQLAF